MNISKKGVELICFYEGLELKAYKCPSSIWTIGLGSTRYEDGTPVKKGDEITRERALSLFKNTIRTYENGVKSNVKSILTQEQFDALTSFVYNVGVANFKNSTLLKKVNKYPNDKSIIIEFNKWIRGAGVVLPGLVKRREAEAKLYFSEN